MVKKFDFLVIGSGIAGMSYALKVAGHGKVALVCKTTLEDANTYFAQGGVASVTNLAVDNFDKHIEDTMIAGGHENRPESVDVLTMDVSFISLRAVLPAVFLFGKTKLIGAQRFFQIIKVVSETFLFSLDFYVNS